MDFQTETPFRLASLQARGLLEVRTRTQDVGEIEVKARAIRRLTEGKRWDPEMINQVRVSPRKPVPGVNSDHIPTDTEGTMMPGHGEDDEAGAARGKEEEPEVNIPRREEKPTKMYVRKTDIAKYGKTPQLPRVSIDGLQVHSGPWTGMPG